MHLVGGCTILKLVLLTSELTKRASEAGVEGDDN